MRRHTRRRTTMNRKGLWAGGVALILLVVGAAALTTVGAGYAKNEDTSSKANCTGTFTFTNGTRYDQFIAPDGSMFTFVRTNPEFVTSGSELRGTAKRVGE